MKASPEFNDLMKPYSGEMQKLALTTRAFVLKRIPKAIEQVDLKSRVAGYGYGTGYKDMICSLMPAKTWVTLGIGWGAELPDPQNLMEGTGKVHRHVKLTQESDLENPALEMIVQAAIEHWRIRRSSKTPTKS